LCGCTQERFASKKGDVFSACCKLVFNVTEKSIDNFFGKLLWRGIVACLIAIGAIEIARVVGDEENLHFVLLAVVEKLQVFLAEKFFLVSFFNQIALFSKFAQVALLGFQLVEEFRFQNIGTSVKRIHNKVAVGIFIFETMLYFDGIII
jgi:hypothetical protein